MVEIYHFIFTVLKICVSLISRKEVKIRIMKKIFMIIINIVLSIIIILLVISIVREKQDDKRYGKKEYEIVIKDKYEIVAPRLFSSRTEFRITYKTRCLNRSEEDFDWKEWDNAVSRKTYIEYNIGDTITKQGMNLNEL